MNRLKPGKRRSRALQGAFCSVLLLALAACKTQPRPDAERALSRIETQETVVAPRQEVSWLTAATAQTAAIPTSSPAQETTSYLLGPGDEIALTVVGQPELSAQHRLGPDGQIAVPLLGAVDLTGLTRDEGAELIREQLTQYFQQEPVVNLDVTDYQNNKVYVLGRVERPGIVELTGAGSLLQCLSEAGGLPVREFRSFLSRCAIIRGRDEILWVDLIELLQGGNIALNIPLRNGDVVFIPDSEDAIVFVMGEVATPGAVPIKVRIDLVQALARAGGPTEDADLQSVYVIRPDASGQPGQPLRVDLESLVENGDFRENLQLAPGDIVYVARNGLGNLNYVLRKLAPSLAGIALGVAASK